MRLAIIISLVRRPLLSVGRSVRRSLIMKKETTSRGHKRRAAIFLLVGRLPMLPFPALRQGILLLALIIIIVVGVVRPLSGGGNSI